jgi:hypothetical protein
MGATSPASPAKEKKRQKSFISLRWQLILTFTFLFTGVFSITFYWFYEFSTERAMSRLRADMEGTLKGAVKGIDVTELMELYEEGEPNAEGFSDDPRYLHQIEWFEFVHSVEPSAWLYTYLIRDTEVTEDNPVGKEMVYLVDLWSTQENTSKAAQFLQVEPCPCPQSIRIFESGTGEVDQSLYTDQFVSWLSAYAPLKDAQGEVQAILGLDLQASYVIQIQQAIRQRILVSFAFTYLFIFVLVYYLSGIFTRNLNRLKVAAEGIGEGNYDQNLEAITDTHFADEITTLADVFSLMVNKVKGREEKLQQQVAELEIEIDEKKRQKQVREITETDFFHELKAKSSKMRERKRTNRRSSEA